MNVGKTMCSFIKLGQEDFWNLYNIHSHDSLKKDCKIRPRLSPSATCCYMREATALFLPKSEI